MTHLVEPMKGVLHRFPLSFQNVISFFPAVGLYLLIHLGYVPMNKLVEPVVKKLPLAEHMLFWSKNDFSTVWSSCFDLIHSPITYYFKQQELESMAFSHNLQIDKLINTFGTLWSMVCTK